MNVVTLSVATDFLSSTLLICRNNELIRQMKRAEEGEIIKGEFKREPDRTKYG